MHELIQVSQNRYYIGCPAKIGLIRAGACSVISIDNGSLTPTASL